MIQPETLDAINYFYDIEIENCEKELSTNNTDVAEAFYRGYLAAMKYAKHTVNLDFIDSNKESE